MRDTEILGAGDPGAVEAMLSGMGIGRGHDAMAEAYRRWGWLAARTNPLGAPSASVPDLAPERYGLTAADAAKLIHAYCGPIGWEIGHVADPARRDWLSARAEADFIPDRSNRIRALNLIAKAECLEQTFDLRMPGAKTFGLSGAEGNMVLLNRVLELAAAVGMDRAIVGGMHRGRLTQAGLAFGKPLARLIADAMGKPEFPEDLGASSDSPYHMGWQGTVDTPSGQIGVWLAPHPSHLSVVAPVAMGRARAAIQAGENVLPLSLHTDAALAGQGINAETFQIAGLAPYDVGGSLHLVLNNQVGFTTGAEQARTSRSCTDVARMTDVPVLHVNGDDPDAILRVAEVAFDYRQMFGTDIIVEVLSYRRKGHNEIDQPRFTQPEMYRQIDDLPLISDRYARKLSELVDLSEFRSELDHAFARARDWHPNDIPAPRGLVHDIEEQMLKPVATGIDISNLQALGERLTRLPVELEPHAKVSEFLAARRKGLEEGIIDWATAETLALASLQTDGHRVRLGGQDSARGAFTQRHLQIHCQRSGLVHDVLGPGAVFNTPLTENAVLAFEYGHSVGAPDALTIWEAQFGDFLNTAQAIFDQFIICGEDRWLFESGLVLLLPHGVDGGGPDHATAHPERLLAACARGNIQVLNPTTPANYFHALRRQVLAPWRKPLVVLAPKTLLRHAGARSSLSDFSGTFKPVIDGPGQGARRVVAATGKLAVLLDEAVKKRALRGIELLRLEQLYPLDQTTIAEVIARHPDAELVWAQEEPENFGYFQWLDRRLERAAGRPWRLISRPASPSASAGPKIWDDRHLQTVIDAALDLT